MNKVITISREFGSGGRELGRRLADELQLKYYDHEIITQIATEEGMSEDFVENMTLKEMDYFPISFGRTFYADTYNEKQMEIFVKMTEVVKKIATQGNCIIVGRCADCILEEFDPIKIFVYSDMESKVARCNDKQNPHENMTDKEIIEKIKQTNENRKTFYSLVSDNKKWGARENYNLCINTSGLEIKDIVPGIAKIIRDGYFKKEER